MKKKSAVEGCSQWCAGDALATSPLQNEPNNCVCVYMHVYVYQLIIHLTAIKI